MAKIQKITLDREVGASYIYLEKIGPGESKRQIPLGNDLVLDFGEDGSLLGIEILDSKVAMDLKSRKLQNSLKRAGIQLEIH